jgi:hypothetical protein
MARHLVALKGSGDTLKQRADLKQRAAAARTLATATKAWSATVTTAAAGSTWRVTSVWIEQGDGARCAELTHVSSGKVRTIRLSQSEPVEMCRERIAGD